MVALFDCEKSKRLGPSHAKEKPSRQLLITLNSKMSKGANTTSMFTDIEAEKAVIGYICKGHQNGLETLKEIAPGICADWFPINKSIFSAALEIDRKGEAVNCMSITEFLHRTGQLEGAGGPLAVVPGDAVLAVVQDCLRKLRDLYRKRMVEEIGKAMANGASPEEAQTLLDMIPPKDVGGKLKSRRFDLLNPPPEATPVLFIADKGICTAGNLAVITGQAKTGKSAVIGATLATLLDGKEHLGMRGGNPEGRAVIHFDTEQSRYDHHQLVRRAMSRAGVKEAPKWLRSYSLADVPTAERRAYLIAEMGAARSDHAGIALVIVDGIADLCLDPNDLPEAISLVEELHRAAIRYDCAILVVLHLNPGTQTGKIRGHLGSELERKVEAVLMVEKEEEAVSLWLANARHGHLPRGQGPRFGWDDHDGMFMPIAGTRSEAKAAAKSEAKRAELKGIAELININGPRKPAVYLQDIMNLKNVSKATAERRFKELKDASIIHQTLSEEWEMAS